jgi:tripartite-type tricarboxylate transporter receptor subunit TctC
MLSAAALALGVVLTPAFAQGWNSKPITIVLPYAAGGPTDMVARLMSQKMGEALGQTVLIENVPGANTMVGAERVARAAPDGNTLLIASVTTVSINPSLYKKIRYKAEDFEPVSMIAKSPFTMTVSPAVPAQNLKEFVAYAKAKPGQVFHGVNPGRGNTNELLGELLNSAAGVKIVPVPYKGLGPALTAVMSGEIQFIFDSINTSMAPHKSGRARIIAISSDKRSPALPEVATFEEQGFPGMTSYFWYGLVAPAGTPRPITERLNAALTSSLKSDEVRARLAPTGLSAEPSAPQEMAELIKRDSEFWGKIIRSLGLELDL